MRAFYLLILFIGSIAISQAQQKFTKEQLLKDADMLYNTILDVHPYMFTNISKEKFEEKLEETKCMLEDSMTIFDFYKMFSPLIAKIEDGHTELHYPVDFAIQHDIEIFPYTFTINKKDTTLIVREGFEDAKFSSCSQILSVNGIQAKELIGQVCSMLSGEAYHFKVERLKFLFSPMLYFVLPSDEFLVEYMYEGKKKTTTIQAKPLSKYIEAFLPSPIGKKPYLFSIDENLEFATLTINSFDIYDNKGKIEYLNFLDSIFSKIAANHINNLIIDIRMNGGGLENLAWDLLQYISPVPFQTTGPSINKISETVKKEYDLEEQTGIYLSGSKGLIPLRENPFRYSGNTYLLTSNLTYSSATKLAWTFQYFKMGKIIGEETGGLIVSYGNVFNANLPNTNLPYGISRWKIYCYGASEGQKHGVIPNIIVPAEKAKDTVVKIIKNKGTN